MILMYHKVDVITPTVWWVTPETLTRHIEQLAHREFVYLDDYDPANPLHAVLTFDDAYENVYRHAFPILSRRAIPFEIFVIGDLIGEWNQFDSTEEPLTRFAGIDQLREMASSGARIQWHSRTHPDLRKLGSSQLTHELSVPRELRELLPHPHFSWLAYPYGYRNENVRDAARARFTGAVVADHESRDRWELGRVMATEKWNPSSGT
jgi:peptidoglycan/xylan/chitin deacetylase (PgdA/CDA1 family)